MSQYTAKIHLEVDSDLRPVLQVKGSIQSVATLLLHTMANHPNFARAVALACEVHAEQQDSQSTTNQNQNQ